LIVGLSAGVPLAFLALLGLALLVAAFLYFKRDLITGKFFNRTVMDDTGVLNNPMHEPAIKVGHNQL